MRVRFPPWAPPRRNPIKRSFPPRNRGSVVTSVSWQPRYDEDHIGGIALFRRDGVRDAAEGRRRHRARGRPCSRRSNCAGGAGCPRAGPRAGEPEGGAGRCHRSWHGPHRRGAYARAGQQRSARACPVWAASATTRRSCLGIAASPRSSGRSWKATRLQGDRCITSPTAGTRARSQRRTGVSSPRAKPRASSGSAHWRPSASRS